MRRTLLSIAALAALLATPVFAQNATNAQPLPAVPPPPPEIIPFDAALEPQVTIRKRDGDTIEEFRMSGRIYMLKVTPSHGVPYYLVDSQGNGNFTRMETLDDRTRVPMWILKTF
jgi:hypothetical protein